jgi:hypothetical protein
MGWLGKVVPFPGEREGGNGFSPLRFGGEPESFFLGAAAMCERCLGGGVFWDSVAGQFLACDCEAGMEEEWFMNRAWNVPDRCEPAGVDEPVRDCPF